MRTPDPSPTARPHPYPLTGNTGDPADSDPVEPTGEEQAALAAHRRHVNETSYLPATADYLHVR